MSAKLKRDIEKCHLKEWFVPGRTVRVSDKMQKGYSYKLTAKYGAIDFDAELTPKQMLDMGIMGGKYLNDCVKEFPKSWFTHAKMRPEGADWTLNKYGVRASLPLRKWIENGWIVKPDVRGWIQWYFRYYIGRRIPKVDEFQIARWKSIARFRGVLRKRPDSAKTKQTLLHWAYDPEKI